MRRMRKPGEAEERQRGSTNLFENELQLADDLRCRLVHVVLALPGARQRARGRPDDQQRAAGILRVPVRLHHPDIVLRRPAPARAVDDAHATLPTRADLGAVVSRVPRCRQRGAAHRQQRQDPADHPHY